MLIFINHDDLRSQEFMEECMRRGYYVTDEVKDIKYADIIYLGNKGLDRKNRVMMNHETVLFQDCILKSLKKECWLLTLIHNDYLDELSQKYHFKYIALLDNDDFLEKNSILTAEGLISFLISHRRFPIYQSRILVLGYGHCGQIIARYLKCLQGIVSVSTRNHKYQEEIINNYDDYIPLENIDLHQQDIIINTIPQMIIDKDKIDTLSRNIMIIDIASYPYGIDHHYALSQGLNSQILPSIPCKYGYGYAGKMICDYIERVIENA